MLHRLLRATQIKEKEEEDEEEGDIARVLQRGTQLDERSVSGYEPILRARAALKEG